MFCLHRRRTTTGTTPGKLCTPGILKITLIQQGFATKKLVAKKQFRPMDGPLEIAAISLGLKIKTHYELGVLPSCERTVAD